jgi:IS4 transposase
MAWALWMNEKNRAAKMHLVFEVMRGVPRKVSVTKGNASEAKQMRDLLEPGRLYVMDRGYTEYHLFEKTIEIGSSFICRIRDHLTWNVIEERPLSAEAKAAGVQRDCVLRFGSKRGGTLIETPLRVVVVSTGKIDAKGEPEILKLATDRMDLEAELVALAYKHRWSVELYFRWFKCILGCRHLLSESENGVEIQVYVGIIASLLISLWTGRKPTKRTLEMVCFYFSGWADEQELLAHIEGLKKHDA